LAEDLEKKVGELEEMVKVLTDMVLQDTEGLNSLREHFLGLLRRVVALEKRY